MPEPVAYLNGQLIPATQASIALYDAGFVQGVTISEQLRTFRGRLFRLDEHLVRLQRSLEIVDVQLDGPLSDLAAIAVEVARHNHTFLNPYDDLGLAILITPGPYSAFAPDDASRKPTVCIHTVPLAFRLFAKRFTTGQAVVTTDVAQVPAACWPHELKCRSRMHYYLADKAAQRREPEARALMLDELGFVTEASTANVVAYFAGEGLVSPPQEKILPGISVAVLEELARANDIQFLYRDFTPDELANADEAFLTSTSPCLLPISRVNGHALTGANGAMFQQMLAAWSTHVNLDIAEQARRFAVRG